MRPEEAGEATSRMTGTPMVTAGQLRRLLDDVPDDVQVIIDLCSVDDRDLEYANVDTVKLPDQDEFIPFVTLVAADTFDPRQP